MSGSRTRDLKRKFAAIQPDIPERYWRAFKKAFHRRTMFYWSQPYWRHYIGMWVV